MREITKRVETNYVQHCLTFDLIPVLVSAILFNCAEPEAITQALSSIHANNHIKARLVAEGIVLGAYANRLTPIAPDWTLSGADEAQAMRSDMAPVRYYNEFVAHWIRDLQVRIVGGCCGFTPEYIQFLHEQLNLEDPNKRL